MRPRYSSPRLRMASSARHSSARSLFQCSKPSLHWVIWAGVAPGGYIWLGMAEKRSSVPSLCFIRGSRSRPSFMLWHATSFLGRLCSSRSLVCRSWSSGMTSQKAHTLPDSGCSRSATSWVRRSVRDTHLRITSYGLARTRLTSSSFSDAEKFRSSSFGSQFARTICRGFRVRKRPVFGPVSPPT
ncbi:hypothetical protein CRUP_035031 [Coryphaenoides rupestris]|nr:hypothetical protein CRUP_035031 [Coryphaenoides rupestris]